MIFEGVMTYEQWKRMQSEWGGGVRRGTKEWRAAWAGLVRLTGDVDREARDPRTHEAWGYLSTFRDRGRWVHEFRHRMHPRVKRRWYVHVPASPGWQPEDDRPKPKKRRRTLH